MSLWFSRPLYLDILQTALDVGEFRFARLAALDWLANYPGDLEVSLRYAQALIAEGHTSQAIAVLQGLRRADPEYRKAVRLLASLAREHLSTEEQSAIETHRFALEGHVPLDGAVLGWGEAIRCALQALEGGDWEGALPYVQQALRQAPQEPLPYVIHLHSLRASPAFSLDQRYAVASEYLRRWPACVPCMLYLASWALEKGLDGEGVAWLHQAVARDVAGQVASRLFGEDHLYRSLWPARLELPLKYPLPAAVAGALGWNRLTGSAGDAASSTQVSTLNLQGDRTDLSFRHRTPHDPQREEATQPTVQELGWALLEGEQPEKPANTQSHVSPGAQIQNSLSDGAVFPASQARPRTEVDAPAPSPPARRLDRPDLTQARLELDALAQRLGQPELASLDGRFPVYIILSLRQRLEAHYGGAVADLIEKEMEALAQAITQRSGWGASLILPDVADSLKPLGLEPLTGADPWRLKLFLADLDQALAKKGARIGALLIVGGGEIVPMHRLPNPAEDFDDDILSDNPYGTRDENYFLPEWPVGRLPGGLERDGALILELLRSLQRAHRQACHPSPWWKRWWEGLLQFFLPSPNGGRRNHNSPFSLGGWLRRYMRRPSAFGYTAAVWQSAAALVFRPLGNPSALLVSPPLGLSSEAVPGGNGAGRSSSEGIPLLRGQLGYFNLHGQADCIEWFGHRDPAGPVHQAEFPIALRPQDVLEAAHDPRQEVPRIVFSEACYGLNVEGRSLRESVALALLQAGCQAVVGSTGMSYGAVDGPLAAADLLAYLFWIFLLEGFPAGEALRQAKIRFIEQASRQRGFLDGEDQKTLTAFNLFGDPLACPLAIPVSLKVNRYRDHSLPEIPLACERADIAGEASPLPLETLASLRQLVARYLPGMADAQVRVARPRLDCNGQGHACVKRTVSEDFTATKEKVRGRTTTAKVVVFTKQERAPGGAHQRVVRLTLDGEGKVVKWVVSR